MAVKRKVVRIDAFNLQPGRVFARNYEVVEMLGKGWEGEVYKIRERHTGIERAAKVFFPQRNIKNAASSIYAKKLHRLKECPMVIHYSHQERILFKKQIVTALISEYVEGELLSNYLAHQSGKRLPVFQGTHLLYALTLGVESIHLLGEYHGDLHTDNIIVRRHGLSYELKLLDFFHWGRASKANKLGDICDVISVFYEAIGGKKHYRKHPQWVKDICCGLKRSLILKKFRSASELKGHLENLSYD